jgi:hypothetical protein
VQTGLGKEERAEGLPEFLSDEDGRCAAFSAVENSVP